MEIRCRKGDCKFNTGCSCGAGIIEVDRGHMCGTYCKDMLKESLIIQNGNLFEVSEELVAKHLKNVGLGCKARNCLFNREAMCYANGISVIGDEGDACCATYIER